MVLLAGCPGGRGFDETGEKSLSIIELGEGDCSLRPVSIAARRYEILRADVTGTDALLAVHTQLPDDTVRTFTGLFLQERQTPPRI